MVVAFQKLTAKGTAKARLVEMTTTARAGVTPGSRSVVAQSRPEGDPMSTPDGGYGDLRTNPIQACRPLRRRWSQPVTAGVRGRVVARSVMGCTMAPAMLLGCGRSSTNPSKPSSASARP